MSTQGVLFCFLHWQKALRSPVAKESAGLAFDLFIDKTLNDDKLVMVVSHDSPAGTIPTSGLHIPYSRGLIPDASALCDDFEFIGNALGRTAY